MGPDGSANTWFTGKPEIGNIVGATASRYFQYKTNFLSDKVFSPSLRSVGISSLSDTSPALVCNVGQAFTSIESFAEIVDAAHVGTTKYQVSPDGVNWYWHNGSTWVSASGYAQ